MFRNLTNERAPRGVVSDVFNDDVIAATRVWIERAVVGLNLCPFAKAVYVKNQIRYTVSEARTA
ncbi:MAG: DUF1415 family protein, partial [Burkholderiales bacterium]